MNGLCSTSAFIGWNFAQLTTKNILNYTELYWMCAIELTNTLGCREWRDMVTAMLPSRNDETTKRTRTWPCAHSFIQRNNTAQHKYTLFFYLLPTNYIIAWIAFKISVLAGKLPSYSSECVCFSAYALDFSLIFPSLINQSMMLSCIFAKQNLRYYSFHDVTQTNIQSHHIPFYYSNFDFCYLHVVLVFVSAIIVIT